MTGHEFLQAYGPTALVTGASSGIGEAFAVQLARGGFDLVISARREQRLEALAARLRDHEGVNVSVCIADLGTLEGVAEVENACAGKDLGLVVSNAGFGLKGDFTGYEAERMDTMLQLNCRAPMLLAQGLLPQLLSRPRSALLFTSSVEGLMGFPWSAAYAASKAFVNSLAEGLWGEFAARGVDVLALCPGSTDTEAHALQGIDPTKLEGMMSAEAVAREALAHVDKGPVHIIGEQNRALFEGVTAMPRRDALVAMGAAMRDSLLGE